MTAPQVGDRDLTASTVSGLRWTYAAALGSSVMQLVYTSSTSRLLDPTAFGFMAIAQLVVRFSIYFAQMGVMQALIQKPDLTRAEIRAAATSSVAFGATASAAVWVLAPWVVQIFDKPAVAPVLQGVGLTFVLTSVGNTSEALLRRALRFRELSLIQVTAFFTGYIVVGIGMASAGYGVWSLVGATLAANIVGSTLRYWRCRHPLVPVARWEPYRDLLHFGSRVSLINFGEFWGVNLDTFTVGRYEVAAMVGQYNRAFYLVNLPLTYITQSMSNVMLPGFAKLQHDRDRVARVYLQVISLIAALMLPICAGVAVAGRELVVVVLGDQWDAAVVLVPILAFAAAWNILTRFAGIICEAIAELNRKLVLQGLHLAALGVLMALATSGGQLWMYAGALAAGEVVRHVLYVRLLQRLIRLPVVVQVRAYGPATTVSATVAVAMWLVGTLLELAGVPVPVRLVALVVAGAAAMAAGWRLPGMRGIRAELVRRMDASGWLSRSRRVRTVVGLLLPEARDRNMSTADAPSTGEDQEVSAAP
jgi:O-antigen/teichoic acid export membrane protein